MIGDAPSFAESSIETRTSRLYEDIHPFEDVEASIENYLKTLGVSPARFSGLDVLDCGFGGTGWASELFARSGARMVAGVDLNRKWALRLRDRLRGYGCDPVLATGDVLNLPFTAGRFDYVHSFGVMHHTTDWKRGVAEMVRVLKPGGSLFLMVYGKFGFVGEAIRRGYRLAGRLVPYCLAAKIVKATGFMRRPDLSILDAMYVPIEEHLSRTEVLNQLIACGMTEIVFRTSYKWCNRPIWTHPLLFGPELNHNVSARKPNEGSAS